jgi:glycerol kinase
MADDAGMPIEEVRVDGGASQNSLMMQFQADILGVDVVRAQIAETTALGAAYLAGLATGFWPDTDTIGAQWQAAARYTPQTDDAKRTRLKERWNNALKRAAGWAIV